MRSLALACLLWLPSCASPEMVRLIQSATPTLGPEHPLSAALAEEKALLRMLSNPISAPLKKPTP